MILDEDEDAEGAKGATDKPLKRRKRQKVFSTIEVSSEGTQSVEASTTPSIRMEARKGSRDAASSCLSQIAELVQVGFTKEFGRECLKGLTLLSKALSANLDSLEIPWSQMQEGILQSLRHSFQVSFFIFLLFYLLLIFLAMFSHFGILQAFFNSAKARYLHRQTKENFNQVIKNTISKEVFKKAQDHAADLTSSLAQTTKALKEIQVEKEALVKARLEDNTQMDTLEIELGKVNKALDKAKLKLVQAM